MPINEDSNLITHARRELELIGEEQEIVEGYLKMISIFADMGHSGGSASIFIPTLMKLLQFENLAPITDDPDDWYEHESAHWDGVHSIWQCKRNGALFSSDGGKTYWDVDDAKRSIHESRHVIKHKKTTKEKN